MDQCLPPKIWNLKSPGRQCMQYPGLFAGFPGASLANNSIRGSPIQELEASCNGKRYLVGVLSPKLFGDFNLNFLHMCLFFEKIVSY